MDAVLFDLFGTLVNNMTPASVGVCLADVAALVGAEPGPFVERWRGTFRGRMDGTVRDGPSMFDPILAVLGVPRDAARTRAAFARWQEELLAGLEPKDDALEALETLRAKGYRLALVTDASSGTSELLDRTPLGAFFEVRAVSALLGTTKPDPRMYEHALAGLGVRGDRCVYVGDGNSRELPGAKAHGMTTVWVDNGDRQHWRHEFAPEGDHRVTRLGEIPALLGSFPGR